MRIPPMPLPFADRRAAGRALAVALGDYRRCAQGVVLGMPRGGVVLAAEIALRLELPLDVVIAHKLGAPRNPEYAIGAVAEDGPAVLDRDAIAATGPSPAYVAEETARQRAAIVRRRLRFRGGRPLCVAPEAVVIVVDDGAATGATAFAAIDAVRALRPHRLVMALPVAPEDTARRLAARVDELLVLATPVPFEAVGRFYRAFGQVSDDEVVTLLEAAGSQRTAPTGGVPPP